MSSQPSSSQTNAAAGQSNAVAGGAPGAFATGQPTMVAIAWGQPNFQYAVNGQTATPYQAVQYLNPMTVGYLPRFQPVQTIMTPQGASIVVPQHQQPVQHQIQYASNLPQLQLQVANNQVPMTASAVQQPKGELHVQNEYQYMRHSTPADSFGDLRVVCEGFDITKQTVASTQITVTLALHGLIPPVALNSDLLQVRLILTKCPDIGNIQKIIPDRYGHRFLQLIKTGDGVNPMSYAENNSGFPSISIETRKVSFVITLVNEYIGLNKKIKCGQFILCFSLNSHIACKPCMSPKFQIPLKKYSSPENYAKLVSAPPTTLTVSSTHWDLIDETGTSSDPIDIVDSDSEKSVMESVKKSTSSSVKKNDIVDSKSKKSGMESVKSTKSAAKQGSSSAKKNVPKSISKSIQIRNAVKIKAKPNSASNIKLPSSSSRLNTKKRIVEMHFLIQPNRIIWEDGNEYWYCLIGFTKRFDAKTKDQIKIHLRPHQRSEIELVYYKDIQPIFQVGRSTAFVLYEYKGLKHETVVRLICTIEDKNNMYVSKGVVSKNHPIGGCNPLKAKFGKEDGHVALFSLEEEKRKNRALCDDSVREIMKNYSRVKGIGMKELAQMVKTDAIGLQRWLYQKGYSEEVGNAAKLWVVEKKLNKRPDPTDFTVCSYLGQCSKMNLGTMPMDALMLRARVIYAAKALRMNIKNVFIEAIDNTNGCKDWLTYDDGLEPRARKMLHDWYMEQTEDALIPYEAIPSESPLKDAFLEHIIQLRLLNNKKLKKQENRASTVLPKSTYKKVCDGKIEASGTRTYDNRTKMTSEPVKEDPTCESHFPAFEDMKLIDRSRKRIASLAESEGLVTSEVSAAEATNASIVLLQFLRPLAVVSKKDGKRLQSYRWEGKGQKVSRKVKRQSYAADSMALNSGNKKRSSIVLADTSSHGMDDTTVSILNAAKYKLKYEEMKRKASSLEHNQITSSVVKSAKAKLRYSQAMKSLRR